MAQWISEFNPLCSEQNIFHDIQFAKCNDLPLLYRNNDFPLLGVTASSYSIDVSIFGVASSSDCHVTGPQLQCKVVINVVFSLMSRESGAREVRNDLKRNSNIGRSQSQSLWQAAAPDLYGPDCGVEKESRIY